MEEVLQGYELAALDFGTTFADAGKLRFSGRVGAVAFAWPLPAGARW